MDKKLRGKEGSDQHADKVFQVVDAESARQVRSDRGSKERIEVQIVSRAWEMDS